MKINVKKQLRYLGKITDNIGLVEHCEGSVSDDNEGWCVDDNARAVQVGLRYKLAKKRIDIYFGFLKMAWRKGKLYNDLNKDLTWKEDFLIDGEHVGRAVAALGEAIKNNYRKAEARELFDTIYPLIKENKTNHLRVIAQTILGLQFYRKEEVFFWADKLQKKYEAESNKDWRWFEEEISYDNGRIPMALLTAYQVTKNKAYLKTGLESLNFLTDLIWNKNYFSFPGNRGWLTKNGRRAKFDQQPIDAGGMVEVYGLAYKITGEKEYADLAQKAFEWYEGRNIFGLKMINEKSGGIFDGLMKKGEVNQNQGAESILSYLTAVKEIENISGP